MPHNQRDISAWLLARERFRLPQTKPPSRDCPGVPVGDVVSRLCARLETSSDFALLRRMQEQWQDMAGPGLAQHAWPARLERQVLTLCVENSIWLNEISRMQNRALMQSLRRRFGPQAVTRLRLLVDAEIVRANCPA